MLRCTTARPRSGHHRGRQSGHRSPPSPARADRRRGSRRRRRLGVRQRRRERRRTRDPRRYPARRRSPPRRRIASSPARPDRRGLAVFAPGFFEYELTDGGRSARHRSPRRRASSRAPTCPPVPAMRAGRRRRPRPRPGRERHAARPLPGTCRASRAWRRAPALWEDLFLPPRAVWLRQATPLRPRADRPGRSTARDSSSPRSSRRRRATGWCSAATTRCERSVGWMPAARRSPLASADARPRRRARRPSSSRSSPTAHRAVRRPAGTRSSRCCCVRPCHAASGQRLISRMREFPSLPCFPCPHQSACCAYGVTLSDDEALALIRDARRHRWPIARDGASGARGCAAAAASFFATTSAPSTPSRTIHRSAGAFPGPTRKPEVPTSTTAPSAPNSSPGRSWSNSSKGLTPCSSSPLRRLCFPFSSSCSCPSPIRPPRRTSGAAPDAALEHARKLLRSTPLIDGHNDLPWEIRESKTAPRDVEAYDLRATHAGAHRLRAAQGRASWARSSGRSTSRARSRTAGTRRCSSSSSTSRGG